MRPYVDFVYLFITLIDFLCGRYMADDGTIENHFENHSGHGEYRRHMNTFRWNAVMQTYAE